MIKSWSYVAMEYPSFMHWFAKKKTMGDLEWWSLPLMGEHHRPIFDFSCIATSEILLAMDGCEWRSYCTKLAATNKVSIFNERKNEWSRVQSMKYAWVGFGCRVIDEKVYVVGGYRFICIGDDSDGDNFYMY